MNKTEYRNYLNSLEWLLKKNELIRVYLENGWSIECCFCKSTSQLQVNHLSYENVGNEILTDERIWDLQWLCRNCHYRFHFEKGFKETMQENMEREFFKYLSAL